PVDVVGEVTEAADIGPDATADVEDRLAFEGDILADEAESAFLARAPDVAGMPERYRLVRGECHKLFLRASTVSPAADASRSPVGRRPRRAGPLTRLT